MTIGFTGIQTGVQLDNGTYLIPLTGTPGGGDSDIVGAGSIGLSDNGNTYRKTTAGAGADKWQVFESAGTSSWREPVLVKDDAVHASLAAAETSMNLGTVDGETVVEGDKVLYTAITGENKNIYTITGTVGAGATLVEDAVNAATLNDVVRVDSGTSALRGFYFDGTDWIDLNSGDYLSNQVIADGDTFESALGKLDAVSMVAFSSLANTAATPVTLESLLVDQYLSVSYQIRITETATQDTTVFMATASHDGDTGNDAATPSIMAERLRGMGVVGGADLAVNLSGAAGAQVLNITAVATDAFDVFVSRYAYTLAP